MRAKKKCPLCGKRLVYISDTSWLKSRRYKNSIEAHRYRRHRCAGCNYGRTFYEVPAEEMQRIVMALENAKKMEELVRRFFKLQTEVVKVAESGAIE